MDDGWMVNGWMDGQMDGLMDGGREGGMGGWVDSFSLQRIRNIKKPDEPSYSAEGTY